MRRLLVLGDSDSGGHGLADVDDAWPNQVRLHLMRQTGDEIELVHRRLAIYAPNAVEFALKCVDEAEPDLIIVTTSTHAFSFQRIALRARDRFGPRGEAFVARLEDGFRRVPAIGRAGSLPDRAGRALGRMVIGSRAYATYEGTVAAYAELIRQLAGRESPGVLIAGATSHARALQQLDSGLAATTRRFNEALNAVAARHRILWLDREALLAAQPDREAAYGPDGAHKSRYGHALLGRATAEAMLELPLFETERV